MLIPFFVSVGLTWITEDGKRGAGPLRQKKENN